MTETKLNKKVMIDIWTLLGAMFLLVQIPFLEQLVNEHNEVTNNISSSTPVLGVEIMYVFVCTLIVLLCSQIYKYRYLVFHTNCKKGTKLSYLAFVLVAAIIILSRLWEANLIIFLYLTMVVIISVHWEVETKDNKKHYKEGETL